MHVPAETMGNRENMILKMIRKSNASILNFVKGIKLRSVGATLLGGLAGLSLTSNIIPSAMEFTGLMDSFSARWALGGYAVYSMIVWGIGGRAAQKTGSKGLGAIILGFAGLTSGLLFTGAGIGTGQNTLLTGGGAALLYGAIGGMIIGDALRNPPSEDTAAPAVCRKEKTPVMNSKDPGKRTTNNDVRLFRFFQ